LSLIALTSTQTRDDLRCARDNFDKKCMKHCKLGNNTEVWNCCEMTRCKKCWMDVGLSVCGSSVKFIINEAISELDAAFASKECEPNADTFPSIKCFHRFHPTPFYAIIFLIITVAALNVIYTMILRRGRRTRSISSS
jgi:hypothetical protein